MDTAKEFLSNADIAFDNGQYEEALKWYRKALEVTPDDIYALSRAGAICVSLKKMDEALIHFGKAKELDPENGDNVFNYANACFYNNEVVKAFNLYAEAERIGCSEDVMPRLYYQMGLMCSLRQDAKAALIYLQKCEEADKDGHIALSSDMISEKIKLYMYLKDYDSAEDCASKLVAAAPTEFKNYMVYYGILMAHSNLAVAEKLLADSRQVR